MSARTLTVKLSEEDQKIVDDGMVALSILAGRTVNKTEATKPVLLEFFKEARRKVESNDQQRKLFVA